MNTLTHQFELGNEDYTDLLVIFECEDYGFGEEFSGTHGKEVDLSYEIEFIECDDDPAMTILLQNEYFYNQICKAILNSDHFLEQADAITFDNDYEEC